MFKDHWQIKAAAGAWLVTLVLAATPAPAFATSLSFHVIIWVSMLFAGEVARRKRLGLYEEHCSYAFGIAFAILIILTMAIAGIDR